MRPADGFRGRALPRLQRRATLLSGECMRTSSTQFRVLMGAMLLGLSSNAHADVVTLKTGEVLIGLVTQDSPKVVAIKLKGEVRLFKPADVASVKFTKEGTGGVEHLGRGR